MPAGARTTASSHRSARRSEVRFRTAREVGDARRRVTPSSAFLELGGDGAEGGAEIGADEGEGSDCGDCDQRGDQSIFDSCNPGLVPDQTGKNGTQAASP